MIDENTFKLSNVGVGTTAKDFILEQNNTKTLDQSELELIVSIMIQSL